MTNVAEEGGPSPIPVVMLSGFLGAGKTTLLRHILRNTDKKVACIVNDVSQINIDAKLIRSSNRSDSNAEGRDPAAEATARPKTTADLADTLELSNGCACCSIQDELLDSFRELLTLSDRRGSPFDVFVLENSGVAEPQNIRDLFLEAMSSDDQAQRELTSRLSLKSLVTVVDSASFTRDFASRAPLAARPDLGDGGNLRPVVDLLVEQVECADVIVANKTDMLPPGKAASLTAVLSSLNPLASVIECQWGEVDLDMVLGFSRPSIMSGLTIEGTHRGALAAARADKADAHHHHGHAHEHDCPECSLRQQTTAAKKYGISTFVYCRRRPFHPQRLRELMLQWIPSTAATAKSGLPSGPTTGQNSPLRRVLRSKGFVWLSSSHAQAQYWSHAGQHFEVREEGDWWAEVPRGEWPGSAAEREAIERDFLQGGDERVGDRRQEVIFIGQAMDESAITCALDTALLTDEEMVQYWDNWVGSMEMVD